ncbi:cystine/glutamate transporter-like [Lethenteron reissneri]|uniref:cystine/glutamate transporter-like n=1 Tax=Lethenteron reissneri TaxID=7753 RepID=UPI002AB6C0BC|nr:cystine/glutamate transporter-like [Lethenteron reissneri]
MKPQRHAEEASPVRLDRTIGFLYGIFMQVGMIIGSGIFISPSGVLRHAGSVGWALLVWLACGFLSLLGALSYAELGTTIRQSGSHYIYLRETLGTLPAFLFLWVEFIIVRPSIMAVVFLSMGQYSLEALYSPCAVPRVAVKLLAMVSISFVVFVNTWSSTLSLRVQSCLSVSKLAALASIIGVGVAHVARGRTEYFENAFDTADSRPGSLPLAFYSGMFAYSGWASLNAVTEEVKRPERTIPVVICASLAIVTVTYLLANAAYCAVLTPSQILGSAAVAQTFAENTLGNAFSTIVPLCVALSCLGGSMGSYFTSPRLFMVASRQRHWPSIFSMIHVRRRTPCPAMLLLLPLLLCLMWLGDVHALINYCSGPQWFFVGLVSLGLVYQRVRRPDLPRPFKVPLAVPALFSCCCLGIVACSVYSSPANLGMGALITLSGVPVYAACLTERGRSAWPERVRRRAEWITQELQLLMEVVPQEETNY